MQGKINYQKLLDELLLEESIKGKRLLLHSCCAPCSSYVLTYLSKYFAITVFYYNPNISEQDEYRKRVEEQTRLIALLNEQPDTIYPINVIEGLCGRRRAVLPLLQASPFGNGKAGKRKAV